jgi:hypothetical protein
VFVLSKGKALLDDGVAHTSVIGVHDGRWVDCVNTEWDSSAIAVARLPSPKLVVVGEDGEVNLYLGDGKSVKEAISPSPMAIRNAKTIHGFVYACGMKRQVFKRDGEKSWRDISAPAAEAVEAEGFEAIDGYSPKDIYAAGWKGEIWRFDGTKWWDCGSRTNLTLTGVCCAPDGLVYVVGQQGILIKGREMAWDLVDLGADVNADFWDVCWFRDRLYVATITGLSTLEGNTLIDVDFGDAKVSSCYNLTAADGVLWSIGRDDVASFDGTVWKVYD